jgi:hypothetical protein
MDEAEGEVRLDNLTLNIKNAQEAKLWYRVLESLQFNEMPFAGADAFPTRGESRQAETWIATALAQHGLQPEDKSDAEGYGNLVLHELLFSSSERNRSVDVGARIWRVSPETLRSKLSAASRFNFTTNPFDFDKPLGNFTDFKGKYPLNEIMAEQVTELAITAAENQTKDGVAEKAIAGHIGRGATKREAIERMLIQQYQNVLRRTPSDEELSKLLALLDRIDKQLGEPYGLQAAYASIILKPETIFRFEGASAEPDANGLIQLSSRELAHALAYAITDRPPERELLATFESSNSSINEQSSWAALIKSAALIEQKELKSVVLSFLAVFILMAAYYMLRPVRDAMASDWSNTEISVLWNIQFFLSLAVVAIYGAAVSRIKLRYLVPAVYGFFSLSFISFFLGGSLISDPVLLDKGFYLWVSLFSLFHLSVFWSFMADLFSREQSKRLFGIITVGASAGAILGPLIASIVAQTVGANVLMPAAALIMLIPLPIIFYLQHLKRVELDNGKLAVDPSTLKIGGNPLEGFKQFFSST